MTDLDFSKYENNPRSVRPLLEYSRQCADRGENDTALLFAEAALESHTCTHDLRIEALERQSISGFYSKLPERRQQGKDACELLTRDKSVAWGTRYTAGQNSTWYAKSASELMPSTVLEHVEFTPPDDYQPMNPSLYRVGNDLYLIQRTVNYIITPSGHYDMRGDDAIRTRNWLLKLNADLEIESAREILPPVDMPDPVYKLVIGFEDCRLFSWQGSLWCTSTVRELNPEGYCEIVLARIDETIEGVLRFADFRVIHPQGQERSHQKNWMPLVQNDQLTFVYQSDPVRIIDDQGATISLKPTHIAADSFRGGSQAVPFKDGWLAIVHESHMMPDHRRRYMHRFVWYDNTFTLARYTEAFWISKLGIEFAAGIAVHPVNGTVVISYGLADKDSWLAIFDPDELWNLMKPIHEPKFTMSTTETNWVESQLNTALQDRLSVERATSILRARGLPSHEDDVKNWDGLVALWETIKHTSKNEPVMDVAATTGSAYLPSLWKYGYETLISINLTQKETEVINGVSYQYGDCTQTTFDDNYFGFVSCLSVIEHGVDVDKFLSESARILKSGGHLFVSTDYWADPVDTFGQTAFGAPVRVFTASDIDQLVDTAGELGLRLVNDCYNTSVKDRVVNWIGMDYTFINLMFVKE